MKPNKKAPLTLEFLIATSMLWLTKQLFKVGVAVLRTTYHVTKILGVAAFRELQKGLSLLKTYLQSEHFNDLQRNVKNAFKRLHLPHFPQSKKEVAPTKESHQRAFLLEMLQDELTPTEIDKLLIKKGEHPYMKLVK